MSKATDDELTVEEFEDLLQIDKDALDDAIVEQPDAFWRVAHKLALQISKRDAAKQNLANVSAEVDAQLRKGATKMTVQEIDARTQVTPSVVKATDQLLRLDHSVREWQALKEAISARGFALRDLVTLYVNEHYQTSSVSGSSTMKDVEAQRTREAMSELRKRSKHT